MFAECCRRRMIYEKSSTKSFNPPRTIFCRVRKPCRGLAALQFAGETTHTALEIQASVVKVNQFGFSARLSRAFHSPFQKFCSVAILSRTALMNNAFIIFAIFWGWFESTKIRKNLDFMERPKKIFLAKTFHQCRFFCNFAT